MKYTVMLALLGQLSAIKLGQMELAEHHHSHHHVRHNKDAYDHDPDTVSQYDHMPQHGKIPEEEKKEHKDRAEKYAGQAIPPQPTPIKAFAQKNSKKHAKDAYDHSPEDVSPYDDGPNINGGNPYIKSIADVPIEGPPIKEAEEKIGKALKKAKEDAEFAKSGVPTPPEAAPSGAESDSKAAFAGAIGVKKDGTPDVESKGASLDKSVQQKDELDAQKAEADEAKAEEAGDKIAAEAVKEVKDKEEKAAADIPKSAPEEKKESPKKEAAKEDAKKEEAAKPEAKKDAPAEKKEEAKAFAQTHHKKHHKRHHRKH